MGGPGSPGFAAVRRGEDWIPREFASLRRQIRENAAARTTEQTAIGQGGLRSADFDGTGPDNPGTTGWMIGRTPSETSWLIMNGRLIIAGDTSIAGLLDIVGQLTIAGPTAIEGELTVTGLTRLLASLELGGNGTVTGLLQSSNYVSGVSGWRLTPTGLEVNTLTAKDAIIGNDALTSPVVPAAFSGSGSGFSTADYTWETKASASIVVPDGFTKAVVTATGYGRVTNSTAASAFVLARPVVQGSAGNEGIANGIGPGAYGAPSTTMSPLLTGMTGGDTVTVTCQVATSTPWAANASNLARISGTVLWFR